MKAALVLPLLLVPALGGAQPPALTLAAPAGSTVVIETTVTIDSPSSGPTEWFAKSDQRWLTVEPKTGMTPTRVTVRANPAGLAPGARRAVLRFVDDAGDPMLVVPVSMTVGPPETEDTPSPVRTPPNPSAPATPKAAPAQVEHDASASVPLSIPVDGLPPATRNLPYSQAIPVRGGTPPYTVRIVDGRLPLGLALRGGALTGVTRVAGTYAIAVRVSDSSVPPQVVAKPLTLKVIILYQNTALAVTASSLTLVSTAGRRTPGARVGVVSGAHPLAWTVAGDQGWLRVSPGLGMAPGVFQVDVDATGLEPGTFAGTLTVTMEGAPNSPMRIPVQVTVKR